MTSCIIPGSFDPLTEGHMNLIRRAAGMFDRVTVTVMVNVSKKGCIPYAEREKIIRKACREIPNVGTERWEGLLADYVRAHPGSFVLRGVRNGAEYEQERTAAAVNRRLYPGTETLLMLSEEGCSEISSSAVREIAAFGGNYEAFVPAEVLEDIRPWLERKE